MKRLNAPWENVGAAKAAGNSSDERFYALEDLHPYGGTSYYRLKQVDFNGDYEYFGPVPVQLEGVEIITLYPNPSAGHIDYTVLSSEEGITFVALTDLLGRKIAGETMQIRSGSNKLSLDVSGYAPGYYLIRVSTEAGQHQAQKQFVVR